MMLFFLFVFLLEVHAILLTAGLLECGDVCHIRAAETGSDSGKPQIHKHPVIMISCQKPRSVALFTYAHYPCCTSDLRVKLYKLRGILLFYGTNVSTIITKGEQNMP